MWLLITHTLHLDLFEDETQKYGRYAIFRHVWLAKESEVSLPDLRSGGELLTYGKKAGWAKIEQTCQRAVAYKLD